MTLAELLLGEESGPRGFQLLLELMTLREKEFGAAFESIWHPKGVRILNNEILFSAGLMTREANENGVTTFAWKTPGLVSRFQYSEIDKNAFPEEYNVRFKERKALNIRISDGVKGSLALEGDKVQAKDLSLARIDGVVRGIIDNAPIWLAGTSGNKAVWGLKTKPKGAEATATLSSLVKKAKERFEAEANQSLLSGAPGRN